MPQNRVVILGAGFIGTSFAAAFLDAGWHVHLVDPDAERRAEADAQVTQHADAIALSNQTLGGRGELEVSETPPGLHDVSMVLECGPEDLPVKQGIFGELLAVAGEETVLATASSAIPMSAILPERSLQKKCLVAHPVNPPSVLRLIELCPAPATDPAVVDRAAAHFRSAGFEPAILAKEIEGFILNRLQGAVLREAYRLVDDGVAEVDDVDKVVRLGLGPRWALSGPFETAELNTPGGIRAHAARLGPAYRRMGEARGERVAWRPDLVERVAAARDALRGGESVEDRAEWRARAVARLVAARNALMRDE